MNIERAAKALAEATNGGTWETTYTEAQRDVWRSRVQLVMKTV